MHLRFLQPMPSGIREILPRFKHVMTIEGNWSDKPEDELIDEDNRRYSALAMMLRSRYLVDVDCWSEARGQPIKPSDICRVVRATLQTEGHCIMSSSLSHCVIKLHEEHHDLEDYQGGVPRWCSGCGDNAILAAVQRLCRDEELAPGEHRVRVGHRLLEPVPALHEDLRLPRHPRPRVAGRRGRSRWRGPT